MNILKRFFSKNSSKDNAYFEIQKSVITDPEIWSQDVIDLEIFLTDTEKIQLLKLCNALQQNIEWHSRYLFNNNYTVDKLRHNNEYHIMSYFELVTFNWVLISNFFKKKSVENEVEKIMLLTIYYSFSGYKNLFKTFSFKSFKTAFDEKTQIHVHLCNLYFNPRQNETEVYQNLFEIIIERPMSENRSDADMNISFLSNFGDLDKMPYSLGFNKHFSEGVTNFIKQLKALKF